MRYRCATPAQEVEKKIVKDLIRVNPRLESCRNSLECPLQNSIEMSSRRRTRKRGQTEGQLTESVCVRVEELNFHVR